MEQRRSIIVGVLAVLLGAGAALAQSRVGIPFEGEEGFLLEVAPDGGTIVVDLGSNRFSRASEVTFELDEGLRALDRKGGVLALEALRPGLEVALAGQQVGRRVVAEEIRLLSTVEAAETGVQGVYESYEAGVAIVGGEPVRLAPGAHIEGAEEWEGMRFASFDEMMLGSFVEVDGKRDGDGLLHATEGRTWPNLYTEADAAVRAALGQSLDLPARRNLSGGEVVLGDQTYRLVEDLELQRYVTEVGYRVIPDYMRRIPDDDPGKIVFRFYVIDEPTFNAFAYADGSVFVHTGLLALIDNEAQLAAVLGHEIAHVTHEHARRQHQRAEKVAKGKKVAKTAGKVLGKLGKLNPFKKKNKVAVEELGVDEEVDLEEVIDFGTGLLSNVYSRRMENQADRVGLYYLHQAGYDPREAPKIWRQIVEQTADRNAIERAEETVETFLYASHPAAKRRLRHLNREVALRWQDVDAEALEVGRSSYRERLDGLGR